VFSFYLEKYRNTCGYRYRYQNDVTDTDTKIPWIRLSKKLYGTNLRKGGSHSLSKARTGIITSVEFVKNKEVK